MIELWLYGLSAVLVLLILGLFLVVFASDWWARRRDRRRRPEPAALRGEELWLYGEFGREGRVGSEDL